MSAAGCREVEEEKWHVCQKKKKGEKERESKTRNMIYMEHE